VSQSKGAGKLLVALGVGCSSGKLSQLNGLHEAASQAASFCFRGISLPPFH